MSNPQCVVHSYLRDQCPHEAVARVSSDTFGDTRVWCGEHLKVVFNGDCGTCVVEYYDGRVETYARPDAYTPIGKAIPVERDVYYQLESHADIRTIDDSETWIRAYNSEGNEVELFIRGLTYGTLADWLRANRPKED